MAEGGDEKMYFMIVNSEQCDEHKIADKPKFINILKKHGLVMIAKFVLSRTKDNRVPLYTNKERINELEYYDKQWIDATNCGLGKVGFEGMFFRLNENDALAPMRIFNLLKRMRYTRRPMSHYTFDQHLKINENCEYVSMFINLVEKSKDDSEDDTLSTEEYDIGDLEKDDIESSSKRTRETNDNEFGQDDNEDRVSAKRTKK